MFSPIRHPRKFGNFATGARPSVRRGGRGRLTLEALEQRLNPAAPSVFTDLADYPPGSTATITARDFAVGSAVEFQVIHAAGPGADGVYGNADDLPGDNSGQGHLPWVVVDGGAGDLDRLANGRIVTTWYVNPDDSLNARFLLSARGAGADGARGTADDQAAYATFTDKASVDLSQWADGPAPDQPTAADQWINGNLGSSKSHYLEGESVPYRAVMSGLEPGATYYVGIEWDTTQGGLHAIDSLTGWDRSFPTSRNETFPGPLAGTSVPAGSAAIAIPVDQRVKNGPDGIAGTADDIMPPSGSMSAFGNVTIDAYVLAGTDGKFGTADDLVFKPGADGTWGTPDDVLPAGKTPADIYTISGTYAGSSQTSLTVRLAYTGASVGQAALAWGGHISSRDNWGDGLSAGSISGSPYHMRMKNFAASNDSSVSTGNQDLSLSSDAVLFPGSITVVKQTTPGGASGPFPFEMTRPVNTVDVLAGGLVDLSGDGAIDSRDTGRFTDSDGEIYAVAAGGGLTLSSAKVDGKVNGYAVVGGLVDVSGNGTIGVEDKFTNLSGTGTVAFSLPGGGSATFGNLSDLSSHTIREIVPSGWDLTSIDTTRIDLNNTTTKSTIINPAGDQQVVVLAEGDKYTLAFNDLALNPAIGLVKSVISVDAAGNGILDRAGEVITYSLVVTNTGDQTLTGVTVVDPVTLTNVQVGTLAVGASRQIAASYTVTQADIDTNGGGDGQIDNTATADSDQTAPVSASRSVPVSRLPGLAIVKSVVSVDTNGKLDLAGDKASYSLVVTNTGNTTLTGVTVLDPLTGLNVTVGTVPVGGLATIPTSYTLTQADIDTNGGGDGQIENTATADSDQTAPTSSTVSLPVFQVPAISLRKVVASVDAAGNGVLDQAGEVITYSLTVTNTGNQTLTGVIVTDPLTGTARTVGTLAVGGSATIATIYTLTQADIDNNGGGDGDIDNTATADSDQTAPTNASASVPLVQAGALRLVKTVQSVDPSVNGVLDRAGDVVTYSLAVTNTGNLTLTGVTVVDPLTGTSVLVGALGVGQSRVITASHAVTQNEIDTNGGGDGDIDNTATADSDQTAPTSASASVPLTRAPRIGLTKTVVSVDPSGDGVLNHAGEVVSYSLVVSNTGNTTLSGVTVTDPLTGTKVSVGILAVGASASIPASYAITQADIDTNAGGDGLIENTATVASDQAGPVSVTRTVPLTRSPLLSLVKTVASVDPSGDGVLNHAGEVVAYNLILSNTGNTTLSGVRVVDLLTGTNVLVGTLAVGATASIPAAYAITQADIDTNGGGDGFIDNTAIGTSNETNPVSDSESVPVSREPALLIAKAVVSVDATGNGIIDHAGEVIRYNLLVTNAGNQTLTGLTVVDPLTGTKVSLATLAVGASANIPATYVVTQADFDTNGGGDGLINNTATADSDQTPPVTASSSTPLVVSSAMSFVKTVVLVDDEGNGVLDHAGEQIHYLLVVTNTGNTTLSGVTVADPLTGTNVTVGLLPVGGVASVPAVYTVTQADIDTNGGGNGLIDNTATADSDQTVPLSGSAAVPIVQLEGLEFRKVVASVDAAGNGIIDHSGEEIRYTLVVTNTGNQTLTGVTVADPLTGTNVPVGTLAVGDTATILTSYIITQADIDTNGGGDGLVNNTATADSDQTAPLSASRAVPLTRSPSVGIVKAVVSVDPAGNGVLDHAGEVINYGLVVTNTGNTTLTGVTVVDPLTGLNAAVGTLPPGATRFIASSYAITQGDIDTNGGGDGFVDNTATADSDQTGPSSDSKAVPLTRSPGVLLAKSVVSVDAAGDGILNRAGDLIRYALVVTNTGNQTLTGVTVTDPLTGTNVPVGTLPVGGSTTILANYSLTQADIDTNGGGDGLIGNTATVVTGQTSPQSDSESVAVVQDPGVRIIKSVVSIDLQGNGILDHAGEVINYALVVTNKGNQTLTGVTVTDPLTGTNVVVGTLAPGATATVNTSYAATQADIDTNGGGDGLIGNTATVRTGQTQPGSGSATVPVSQVPGLALLKTVVSVDPSGNGILDHAGEVVNYALAVTNTGNQTLTGVMVTDPLTGTSAKVGVLAPGATVVVPASYAITQGDIDTNGGDDGFIHNTATADSDQTDPVSDFQAVRLVQAPALDFRKLVDSVDAAGNGIIDHAGEVIRYSLVVTNTGNQTLTGVTVTDPLTGTSVAVGTVAPGATATVSASYTVTQADIDTSGGGDGHIDNTATVTTGQTEPGSSSQSVPLTVAPGLGFVKEVGSVDPAGNGVADHAGEVITFNLVVTNTGNQTLTGVTVTDPLTGTSVLVGTLAVGVSRTIATVYTVTQADIDGNGGGDGLIDNIATADSDQTEGTSDSATVPLRQLPGIQILKSVVSIDAGGNGVIDHPGEVITYSILVANTGNQTLTGVVVTDPLTGTNVPVGTLAPGAGATIGASHTVTFEEIETNGGGDGRIDNTATVASDQTEPVSSSAFVPLVQHSGIGDFVWEDINGDGRQDPGEPGIAGARVALLDSQGNELAVTSTDATGHYEFHAIPLGTYGVRFDPPTGYLPSVANQGDDATDSDPVGGVAGPIVLSSTIVNTSIDAGFYKPAAIGNYVFNDLNFNGLQDPGEPGIPGVTVRLLDTKDQIVQIVTSDAKGFYEFTNLVPAVYYVTRSTLPGYVHTLEDVGNNDAIDSDANPATTIPVSIVSGDYDSTIDFGFYQPPAIGDRVWKDLNMNGRQDAGEPGIANATVQLLDSQGMLLATTLTDASGNYVFGSLTPGTYRVRFITPAGLAPTIANRGNDTGDSDAVGGITAPITLGSGETNLTVDAGFRRQLGREAAIPYLSCGKEKCCKCESYKYLFDPCKGILRDTTDHSKTYSILVDGNGNRVKLCDLKKCEQIARYLAGSFGTRNTAYALSGQLLLMELNVMNHRVRATDSVLVGAAAFPGASTATANAIRRALTVAPKGANPWTRLTAFDGGMANVQAVMDASIAQIRVNRLTVAPGGNKNYQHALTSLLFAMNNNQRIYIY